MAAVVPERAQVAQASFRIAYDGPALASHTIDVRDLAPVLLALGDTIDAANAVLNGDRARVSLRVSATGEGCFTITLDVVQSFLAHAVDMLAGQRVTAGLNLIQVLGLVGSSSIGVLALIKKLRGRAIPDVSPDAAGGRTFVLDGITIVLEQNVFVLYNDARVRSGIEAAVADPLSRDGVDEVRLLDGEDPIVITKDDAPYFKMQPAPEFVVNEYRAKSVFTLSDVSFRQGGKWRLHDGTSTQPVTIADIDFLRRVDAHEVVFAKDDVLTCDVLIIQRMTDGRLRSETIIETVLEHEHAARQSGLPL